MCFSQAPAPGARSPQRLKFRERLRELGWVEGQNLVIEERWAENRYDRLPALMAEVIGRKVDVLVTYTTPAAIESSKVRFSRARQAATGRVRPFKTPKQPLLSRLPPFSPTPC